MPRSYAPNERAVSRLDPRSYSGPRFGMPHLEVRGAAGGGNGPSQPESDSAVVHSALVSVGRTLRNLQEQGEGNKRFQQDMQSSFTSLDGRVQQMEPWINANAGAAAARAAGPEPAAAATAAATAAAAGGGPSTAAAGSEGNNH